MKMLDIGDGYCRGVSLYRCFAGEAIQLDGGLRTGGVKWTH